jgi:hypothetical protein
MYFPYLFGRRSELLSLRDIVGLMSTDASAIPVVEPVRSKLGSLALTIKTLRDAQQSIYVVVNPVLGDFSTAAPNGEWRKKMDELIQKYDNVRPTFLASPTADLSSLKVFVSRYKSRPVGVVLRNSPISPAIISAELSKAQRTFFITGGSPMMSVLSVLNKKHCVHVEDRFETQPNNASYSGIEPFTDRHLHYAKEGWAGFGDYTVLPGVYKEGGGPVGAVAIHLTFFPKKTKEIYVEHFISDTTSNKIRDDNGKFMEALPKLHAATKRSRDSFGLTIAIQKYLAAYSHDDPPTLANNKRWEISHHVELVGGLMAGRFG